MTGQTKLRIIKHWIILNDNVKLIAVFKEFISFYMYIIM